MKKLLTPLVFILFTTTSYAQFGIGFHQSNLPFAELHYTVENRIRGSLRLGTDNFFDDTGIEVGVMYDIFHNTEFEWYAGVMGRAILLDGIVIPIGTNIYPFENKCFGFHAELASIIGDDNILRGSFGIRYRFLPRKNDDED